MRAIKSYYCGDGSGEVGPGAVRDVGVEAEGTEGLGVRGLGEGLGEAGGGAAGQVLGEEVGAFADGGAGEAGEVGGCGAVFVGGYAVLAGGHEDDVFAEGEEVLDGGGGVDGGGEEDGGGALGGDEAAGAVGGGEDDAAVAGDGGLAGAVPGVEAGGRDALALAEEEGFGVGGLAGEGLLHAADDAQLAGAVVEEHGRGRAGAEGIDDDGGAAVGDGMGAAGFAVDDVPHGLGAPFTFRAGEVGFSRLEA